MKVYILFCGQYADRHILNVHWTREAAEADGAQYSHDPTDIEEWDVIGASEPIDYRDLYTRPPEGLTRAQQVERLREMVRQQNDRMKDWPGHTPIVVPEDY